MRSTAVPEPPRLNDGEVLLRRRRAADVPAIAAGVNDPDSLRWLDPPPPDADVVEASLRRSDEAYASGTAAPLVIADVRTDEPLGLVTVQFRSDTLATLSYSVFPAARGRGAAGRAVALVRQWAFGGLGLAELRLEVDPANTASMRVAEKAGWTHLSGITTPRGEQVFVAHAPLGDVAPVWAGVTVDAVDVTLVAGFWAALLRQEPRESLPGWLRIGPLTDGGPVLTVQPVPEPKTTKARLHLDLHTADLGATVSDVERLGGRRTGERHEYPEGIVEVMIDPEGTEFCLVWLRGDDA